MTFFEFVLVMISVIYALSIAPLLSGVVRIAQTNLPVRHYLPQAIWAGNVFVVILLMWWALWGFRSLEWTFSSFVFISIEPILMLFVCSLLFPHRLEGPEVDLKVHFAKIAPLFFVTFFVLLVLVSIDGVILGTEPLWDANRYFQVAAWALVACMYFDRRDKAQLAGAVIYFLLLIVFVAMRWVSPPG